MENNRYHRQELFQPIGKEGQQKLRNCHVLIVGAGALGSSSAEQLVRAGVGTVSLVDRDYVELTNLQRQQLYTEEDVSEQMPKAVAAEQRLQKINQDVTVHAHVIDAGPEELSSFAQYVDLMIDATDNFDTRFVMNDVSQKYEIPWIYGACVSSYGVTFTVLPGETPCLQCLIDYIPKDGATCDTVGIINPAVQMVVSYQVTEALKYLVGDTGAMMGQLIGFDLWKNERMELSVASLKKDDCPSCSAQRTLPYLAYQNQLKTAVLCGRDTVQIRPPREERVNISDLAQSLKRNEQVKLFENPYLLSMEIDDVRLVLFQDGRTLIHGTKDITEAKKIYYQYVG
ncbi:thiamine/molybdopterin biosynthesis ThiF/MoeB-like protein [Gracilibacillus halophilus YIM-C55.5]|uniref:Thiamine/molybdopterin biosynthesis ThiF/MoeB-like protein n=1 Tax=Gracilibacillus halophilus YIM-C55.5 TaxID=1308866 RepID=N4W8Q9_9BACI|nr:MoeB/ThiF family adenylyltransferase [Gracilibacillus halophilus]ENH95579.1 thiamine/molybdopterin biosynthesis ThiF/MoeB-like protein [Gracilibacillus halophilus YIM-C55.5]